MENKPRHGDGALPGPSRGWATLPAVRRACGPPRPAPPKAQGLVPVTLRQKDWQRPGNWAILTGERLHPMQPTEGASGASLRTGCQSLR